MTRNTPGERWYQRLLRLYPRDFRDGFPLMRVSALNYLSWAERSQRLEAIGAFGSAGRTLTGGGDPELLSGSFVTASHFRVLGVRPIVGRTLQPEDEQRAGARVVVLGESLWRSRFGGDRNIVRRSITLDGERHQVVGVMPRTFREVGRIMGLVLREGMTWAGTGIVLGLIAAFAAARVIATLLFDVPARDPVTFAMVAGAVALVALMACSIPAARAVRIDLTTAMRTE